MPRTDLRAFLERSLNLLAREAPGAYSRLCGTLAGRRLCVEGDGMAFTLRFDADAAVSRAALGDEEISISVDRRSILALVDGELTLEEALRQDRLVVRGAVADAARAFDALLIFVRGAIRCPSFPALLSEFRSSDSAEELRQ